MKTYKCEICGDVYKKTMSVNDETIVQGICGSKCVEKYVAKYMITSPDTTKTPNGLVGTTEQLSMLPEKTDD